MRAALVASAGVAVVAAAAAAVATAAILAVACAHGAGWAIIFDEVLEVHDLPTSMQSNSRQTYHFALALGRHKPVVCPCQQYTHACKSPTWWNLKVCLPARLVDMPRAMCNPDSAEKPWRCGAQNGLGRDSADGAARVGVADGCMFKLQAAKRSTWAHAFWRRQAGSKAAGLGTCILAQAHRQQSRWPGRMHFGASKPTAKPWPGRMHFGAGCRQKQLRQAQQERQRVGAPSRHATWAHRMRWYYPCRAAYARCDACAHALPATAPHQDTVTPFSYHAPPASP
eukprot:365134-Chlamydomonas_euryale.AAC.7